MAEAAVWIERLGLLPHPEGGYYRRVYTAPVTLELPHGVRPAMTAIYYLLPAGARSRLHRLSADECWYFHQGAALTVHVLTAAGVYTPYRLGPDPLRDTLQLTVPAGVWFGATVNSASGFALVGCTVTPGFDFADFELGQRRTLLAQYPQHAALICQLTDEE